MDRTNIGNLINKSVNSPRRRLSLVQSLKKNNSVISLSGRSNQSVQVICRTEKHVVENFGSTLPVLVTEALTFVDRHTTVSVCVSVDGWAWLVCGRRLLIWQCKTTIHDPRQRRTFKSQCRELLLPQSDLAHKADCIAVWLPPGQLVPSCMAASPEGVVRYWSSIANEGSSIETSTDLTGQEVTCLVHIPGNGCILATTSCTIALLQLQFLGGRSTLSCRVLRTSQGWLGGIGRRMSSLIFGGMPQTPVSETKIVKAVCMETNERGTRVLVSAGTSLQLWSFQNGESEKMEFDEDISLHISQSFQKRLWESRVCNPQMIKTWLIDVQPCEEGVVVLVATFNTDISPQVFFAVGLIPLSGVSLTISFKWFIPVDLGLLLIMVYTEDVVSDLNYRIILSGSEIIIFDDQKIVVVNNFQNEQDEINLTQVSTKNNVPGTGRYNILGGALCSGTPVLFTRNHGLITITSSDFASQDFNVFSDVNASMDFATSFSEGQENFSNLVSNEELAEMISSSDGATQLRAAFLHSLRQNKPQCEEILFDLFPLQEEPVMDIDATLDTLILKVAKDLIDDYPANDPRWTNHRDLSITVNAVVSVQIPHQLEGKQRAIDLYLAFLKEYNLWSRFCAVSYRGIIMSTSHVLGEFAEKIIAALTIYNLQQRYQDIIDTVIEKTLPQEAYVSEELSAHDIFYREVSMVHRFLPNLVQSATEQTQSERHTQQVAQYILQVNSILLAVLHEVVKYRQYNAEKFVPTRCSSVTEYLPWTAATGKHGLRTCLNTMQNLTLKHGVNNTSDSVIRNELYEQLVGLIDLILDGRKCHLESIRGTEKFEILLKQYEAERNNLIQPLVKDQQYENAAMLAEKYCDFSTLVQICELTNNKTRLDAYMERFASQDFAGHLFNWYVKDGRQGQLVERCRRGGATELTEKLSEHPVLSWVQDALTDEFRLAANTLHSLAVQETELVMRKKSMLSLAKLALLCTDDADSQQDDCEQLDSELLLIAHQEDLPSQVLAAYSYDIEKLRVLSAADLISLYTCEENTLANEYDFKKALDLLAYIESECDQGSLKLRVWARAAARDKWESVSKNPEQQVQNTLFFKLMDLVHLMGSTEEPLPPVDLLLAEPELGNLAASSTFQYLIKLVYEYAYHNY